MRNGNMNPFFGLNVSIICPTCDKGFFVKDYGVQVCPCKAQFEIPDSELNKLLIEALIRDRDSWKSAAIRKTINYKKPALQRNLNGWIIVPQL
jgi:hypothetical protein